MPDGGDEENGRAELVDEAQRQGHLREQGPDARATWINVIPPSASAEARCAGVEVPTVMRHS